MRSLIAQPKRFAMLTYLAADSGRQHSRDELMSVFWPDREFDDASNALRQALHYVRRSLGEGVIVGRGDRQLEIDFELLKCDVRDFEQRVASGDLEGALSLYGGELVEGLNVAGCPAFDHWRDQRSATLGRFALEAAARLSERKAEEGDISAAVEFARTALALDPSGESHVRALMRLLARSGDRGGSVVVYEEFERRFKEELCLEPSPETMSLLHEIRDGTDTAATASLTDDETRKQLTPVTASPAVDAPGSRWRIGVAVAAILAVGGAALTVMNMRDGSVSEIDLPRLVVLPFENLGDPADDYFADGMTEEITSNLSGLAGLQVIARQTAIQYERSTLSAGEIGQDLDVDYVLEGTVRTDRVPGGNGQVRITPQLIRASDEIHIWSEPYTADLVAGDIFRIQAEMATRIAERMSVVLPDPERESVAQVGTESQEALDFYLRGTGYIDRGVRRLEDFRLAAEMFEMAVAADSNYVEALSMLAQTYSELGAPFSFAQPDIGLKARNTVDRVVRLAPNHPASHVAMGHYHRLYTRRFDLMETSFRTARRARPNDASVLWRLAEAQALQGKREETAATVEDALAIDPRSEVGRLARTLLTASHYAEAEVLFDRAILLEPDNPYHYFFKAILYLGWNGLRERAEEVVVAAAGRADLANMMLVSWDYDDELVLRMFADHFDDEILKRALDDPADSVAYYFARGNAAQRHIDSTEADAYYDSARVVLEHRLADLSDAHRTTANLGLAYALLGRAEDARRIAVEVDDGARLAQIYTLTGDHDRAVELLAGLQSTDPLVSVPMLRIDPLWDPLRDHPQFEALLASEEN